MPYGIVKWHAVLYKYIITPALAVHGLSNPGVLRLQGLGYAICTSA